MFRLIQIFALFITLIALAPNRGFGGFVFAFNTFGTNQDFVAGAGEATFVPVYLVQTDGEDRLTTIGMGAAGVSVTYTYGAGPIGEATVHSAMLAAHWTDTFSNLVSYQPNRVVMEGIVNDPSFPVFDTSNAVLLGTIKFHAGALGNVTNLTLSLDGVTPSWNNLATAESVTPTFRSGSITAVPEPTSLTLIAVITSIGVCLRKRHLKKSILSLG